MSHRWVVYQNPRECTRDKTRDKTQVIKLLLLSASWFKLRYCCLCLSSLLFALITERISIQTSSGRNTQRLTQMQRIVLYICSVHETNVLAHAKSKKAPLACFTQMVILWHKWVVKPTIWTDFWLTLWCNPYAVSTTSIIPHSLQLNLLPTSHLTSFFALQAQWLTNVQSSLRLP